MPSPFRRLRPVSGWFAGWRGLGLFWAAMLVGLGAVAGVLQILGPPPARPEPGQLRAAPAPGRSNPGPIAAPDPALLEPLAGDPGHFLPRIGADGRAPMAVYAAPFPSAARGPRVGLLVAGIGLDHPASEAAVRDLPGAVTLAVSPYAQNLNALLAAARANGHEYLLSIPMQPRSRLDDAGSGALSTALPPEENTLLLDRVLSRLDGYVGVTGALGRLRGERFAADADQMASMLGVIAERGLLYIDPRTDAPRLPSVWSRAVDVVVDESEASEAIDAQLAELAQRAREHGSALGLVGAIRPVTLERVAAWAKELSKQGLVLAPVSALVRAPDKAR